MKLPKIAIQNCQFTLIIIIIMVLSGIMALMQMPKSEDPPVSSPGAGIYVIYPGATPTDLEHLVVEPIEDVLNELDDIKKMESTCKDGLAIIKIEFLMGTDPDEKFSDVNEKINTIQDQLPNDILDLETMKWEISNTKFYQVALVSEEADYRELEKEAERLEKILKKINGIKRSTTWAYPQQEIRVSLDLEKMAQLRISMKRVFGALQSSNVNIPGGTIDAGSKRFSIKTSGSYDSLDQIKETVVYSKGTKVIYLKDIAKVFLTYEDRNYFARFNGQRCVFVTATQKEGTNIYRIMDVLEEKVKDFEEKLPQYIQLEVVHDQSISVNNRIQGFLSNMLQGIFLVGIVILIAIGIRGSIIVMAAIPISILISLAFVYKSGYGLQQMSITGLVITLGLLVDNAIVVVENISRFIKKGETNLNAAIKGTSQIGWAIVSATATTILAFFPILMMPNISGEFIRSMPLTVIYTLAASLLIALIFTPFLASKMLRTTAKRKNGKIISALEWFIENRYRKWLRFSLKRPLIIIALAVMIFISSIALFPLIGVSFFPKAEKKQFFINVKLPEGSSIHQTDRVVKDIEKKLLKQEELQHCAANIGRSNPQIYYNVISQRQQTNIGHIYVKLQDSVEMKQIPELIQNLRTEFVNYPGAKIEVKELEQGPPVNAPIEIKIRGEKLKVLKKIASDMENMFQKVSGLININNPLGTSKTDIRIEINRDKAAMYGIPLLDIDRTVRMSIAGVVIGTYRDKEGKQYNIVVRSGFGKAPHLDIFNQIYLSTASGSYIPLNQIAQVKLEPSPTEINHFNMDRSVTLTADVLGGYSINDVTTEIINKLEQYQWPIGYDYFVGGEKESQDESFGGMGEAVLIAIFAIFAVLVLQFKSFTQPLIVYAALPLAIIGSVLALLITGYTFSFTAFIGLTSLVGIVVNNSIILVDYINQLRQTGEELVSAIIKAGETRFMPIVLTTLTTIGGLLPLTLQGGTLWAPMGWTIIGGLLTSTALTLLVVPVLYKMFSNHKKV